VSYCRDATWFTKPQMRLNFIDCSSCQNVTEKTLELFRSNAPNLTSLNISNCSLLKGESLRLLKGSKIQTLWMNDIDLEAAVVNENKEFFSQLIKLSVIGCRITTSACNELDKYGYQLQDLNLRDNPDLSFEALKSLILNLEGLKTLNIMGTTLSSDQIGQLTALRPLLKIST
jgi:hypothetical protein